MGLDQLVNAAFYAVGFGAGLAIFLWFMLGLVLGD